MNNEKDWKGVEKYGMLNIIGAGNGSNACRAERDFYATDPQCLESLLQFETFSLNVWEPCCGEGHLSNVLKSHGYNVKESDIVDRIGNEVVDFLFFNQVFDGDIITNPPYSSAAEFVEQAMLSIPDGHKVAMFLKLTFLEGKSRRNLFKKYPPYSSMFSASDRDAPLTAISRP